MQSPRELIDNMLRDKPFDRVGLAENIWPQTLRKWIKEGYPVDDQDKPVDPALHFGFDIAPAACKFDLDPHHGFSEVIEETNEWIIKKDGAGVIAKRWKVKAGVPQKISFSMADREVWEKEYRSHWLNVDRNRLNLEATRESLGRRRNQDKFALFGRAFIWERMRQNLGDVCLYENLLLDPDWIHDYCRVFTDFFKAHFKIVFEEAGKPDGFRLCEDLGYHKGLFCSPDTFRELIFPYYREIVEFFHSYGFPVFLHSCGGVEEALDLIVEAGFDGLDPMEVKAGCDAIRFARKYRDQLVFRGGLDVRILEKGDRDLIRGSVIDLVEGMKSVGARFVFSSDHSISTNVSYDSYRYALDVYREHMMY